MSNGRPAPPSAGVIGWPVAHSKSPLIHRFWLEHLGLDGDYGRFPVHPDRLESALRALPALGLAGVNVTVPHKQAVIPFLDHVAEEAAAIGAVNTVVVGHDGALWGMNTDWIGVQHAIPINEEGRHIAIVGAGGAARAAVHAARTMKAGRITILNRSEANARAMLDTMGVDGDVRALGPAPACDLLINASPLGMTGQPPLDVALDALPGDAAVFDMVYAPLDTLLLQAARGRGLRTIDGIAMLIGQAAEAFRLFYGEKPHEGDTPALRALLVP